MTLAGTIEGLRASILGEPANGWSAGPGRTRQPRAPETFSLSTRASRPFGVIEVQVIVVPSPAL